MRFPILLVSFVLVGADWPQFRGPAGSGIAEGSAPVEFGLKQKVVWALDAPIGHSSPSIWGDHVFLTGFDPKTNQLEVLDVERSSGRTRWRRTIAAKELEKVHATSNPATATAAADGERVYVYFGSAGLFCWNFAGEPVWNIPMAVANIGYGSGTSPVLAGDAVILARDDSADSLMLAVDRKTGRQLWKIPLAKAGFQSHATPLIWQDQIVLHQPLAIRAYALKDGSALWWASIESQGTGSPVIAGNVLYVGAWFGEASLRDPVPDWQTLVEKYDKNGDGFISKEEFPDDLAITRRTDAGNTPGAVVTFKTFFDRGLDMNRDGKISKEEWETITRSMQRPGKPGILAIRLGGEGDVTKTSLVWAEERSIPEVPVPLVYRGRVYAITNGGVVTVLDAASGKLIYRARVGAGGLYYSSPVAAQGRVYVASGEGMVTVIDAAADQIKVLAHNDLGEPIFATPAIVDNHIYIRSSAHLYAFAEPNR